MLGAVEWEIPAQGLAEDKLELAQELANRLALSLDNARLFQESQRTTERERLVNSIATKLTAQTTINDILETAVREVGQALRAPQVSIRLQTLRRLLVMVTVMAITRRMTAKDRRWRASDDK